MCIIRNWKRIGLSLPYKSSDGFQEVNTNLNVNLNLRNGNGRSHERRPYRDIDYSTLSHKKRRQNNLVSRKPIQTTVNESDEYYYINTSKGRIKRRRHYKPITNVKTSNTDVHNSPNERRVKTTTVSHTRPETNTKSTIEKRKRTKHNKPTFHAVSIGNVDVNDITTNPTTPSSGKLSLNNVAVRDVTVNTPPPPVVPITNSDTDITLNQSNDVTNKNSITVNVNSSKNRNKVIKTSLSVSLISHNNNRRDHRSSNSRNSNFLKLNSYNRHVAKTANPPKTYIPKLKEKPKIANAPKINTKSHRKPLHSTPTKPHTKIATKPSTKISTNHVTYPLYGYYEPISTSAMHTSKKRKSRKQILDSTTKTRTRNHNSVAKLPKISPTLPVLANLTVKLPVTIEPESTDSRFAELSSDEYYYINTSQGRVKRRRHNKPIANVRTKRTDVHNSLNDDTRRNQHIKRKPKVILDEPITQNNTDVNDSLNKTNKRVKTTTVSHKHQETKTKSTIKKRTHAKHNKPKFHAASIGNTNIGDVTINPTTTPLNGKLSLGNVAVGDVTINTLPPPVVPITNDGTDITFNKGNVVTNKNSISINVNSSKNRNKGIKTSLSANLISHNNDKNRSRSSSTNGKFVELNRNSKKRSIVQATNLPQTYLPIPKETAKISPALKVNMNTSNKTPTKVPTKAWISPSTPTIHTSMNRKSAKQTRKTHTRNRHYVAKKPNISPTLPKHPIPTVKLPQNIDSSQASTEISNRFAELSYLDDSNEFEHSAETLSVQSKPVIGTTNIVKPTATVTHTIIPTPAITIPTVKPTPRIVPTPVIVTTPISIPVLPATLPAITTTATNHHISPTTVIKNSVAVTTITENKSNIVNNSNNLRVKMNSSQNSNVIIGTSLSVRQSSHDNTINGERKIDHAHWDYVWNSDNRDVSNTESGFNSNSFTQLQSSENTSDKSGTSVATTTKTQTHKLHHRKHTNNSNANDRHRHISGTDYRYNEDSDGQSNRQSKIITNPIDVIQPTDEIQSKATAAVAKNAIDTANIIDANTTARALAILSTDQPINIPTITNTRGISGTGTAGGIKITVNKNNVLTNSADISVNKNSSKNSNKIKNTSLSVTVNSHDNNK